jgi:hypothetical protein
MLPENVIFMGLCCAVDAATPSWSINATVAIFFIVFLPPLVQAEGAGKSCHLSVVFFLRRG